MSLPIVPYGESSGLALFSILLLFGLVSKPTQVKGVVPLAVVGITSLCVAIGSFICGEVTRANSHSEVIEATKEIKAGLLDMKNSLNGLSGALSAATFSISVGASLISTSILSVGVLGAGFGIKFLALERAKQIERTNEKKEAVLSVLEEVFTTELPEDLGDNIFAPSEIEKMRRLGKVQIGSAMVHANLGHPMSEDLEFPDLMASVLVLSLCRRFDAVRSLLTSNMRHVLSTDLDSRILRAMMDCPPLRNKMVHYLENGQFLDGALGTRSITWMAHRKFVVDNEKLHRNDLKALHIHEKTTVDSLVRVACQNEVHLFDGVGNMVKESPWFALPLTVPVCAAALPITGIHRLINCLWDWPYPDVQDTAYIYGPLLLDNFPLAKRRAKEIYQNYVAQEKLNKDVAEEVIKKDDELEMDQDVAERVIKNRVSEVEMDEEIEKLKEEDA